MPVRHLLQAHLEEVVERGARLAGADFSATDRRRSALPTSASTRAGAQSQRSRPIAISAPHVLALGQVLDQDRGVDDVHQSPRPSRM